MVTVIVNLLSTSSTQQHTTNNISGHQVLIERETMVDQGDHTVLSQKLTEAEHII